MGWGILLALAISILIAALIFHALRKIAPLILHGVLGLLVFWLLSQFGILKVPIDIVTFLIAALGGVLGVLVVIALAAFGVPL